eukprot:gene49575-66407_t
MFDDESYEEILQNSKSERYKSLKRIGEGAFGDVRLGIDNDNGAIVALKYVKILSRKNNGIPKAVFREMESLRHLSCPFICKLLDVFPNESNLVLVLEYLPSDLAEVILQSSKHLPSSHLKSYTFMLLEAVCHCHSNNIVHRDIKPSNILLSAKGQLKLGDFGLARVISPVSNQSLSHQVATRSYRAPELLFASRSYSFAVDMWSVGVVLGELMLLSPLFP